MKESARLLIQRTSGQSCRTIASHPTSLHSYDKLRQAGSIPLTTANRLRGSLPVVEADLQSACRLLPQDNVGRCKGSKGGNGSVIRR